MEKINITLMIVGVGLIAALTFVHDALLKIALAIGGICQ